MQARDIMTEHVITVGPDTSVREIATLLLDKHISAVPVVDEAGALAGIVSEGDLIHRSEIGTEERGRSWWLRLFDDTSELAERYAKSHGAKARDVMTRDVVSVAETASVAEIAELLETKHIKRVPVTRDGALAGIVSRANIVRALAASPETAIEPASPDDAAIRRKIVDLLRAEPWGNCWNTSVFVTDGVVEFWGIVESEAERTASRIAAEGIAGVTEVRDRRGLHPHAPTGI
jgi:CBS domain-containing protein